MNTIKKTGSFEGSSNKLGGGGRFKQMVASGKSPALAAFISRKIYGKKKTQQMAAAGKKKSKDDSSTVMTSKVPKGIVVGNPKMVK